MVNDVEIRKSSRVTMQAFCECGFVPIAYSSIEYFLLNLLFVSSTMLPVTGFLFEDLLKMGCCC